jgi:hypothetical protein
MGLCAKALLGTGFASVGVLGLFIWWRSRRNLSGRNPPIDTCESSVAGENRAVAIPQDEIDKMIAEARGLLDAVLVDCTECNRIILNQDGPFYRRLAFRTIFSSIEALSNHALGQAALRHRHGIGTFAPKDVSKLDPEAWLPFNERIKAALTLLPKALGKTPPEFRGTGWDSLIQSAHVRDRITHPKKASDYAVSEQEVVKAGVGFNWFTEQLARSVASPDSPFPFDSGSQTSPGGS